MMKSNTLIQASIMAFNADYIQRMKEEKEADAVRLGRQVAQETAKRILDLVVPEEDVKVALWDTGVGDYSVVIGFLSFEVETEIGTLHFEVKMGVTGWDRTCTLSASMATVPGAGTWAVHAKYNLGEWVETKVLPLLEAVNVAQ